MYSKAEQWFEGNGTTVVDLILFFLSMIHANPIFKTKSGRILFDYLTEYRMEKAKSLLRSGESELHSVARQVGYASKAHFCLSFKRATGLTPSEYIEQFRD